MGPTRSADEICDTVADANELHAKGELFTRATLHEPAPDEPVEWVTLEDAEEHVHDEIASEPVLITLPAE